MPTETIDVAIPTWESGDVLGETLDRLATAAAASRFSVDTLIVIDKHSDDDTRQITREKAAEHGWTADVSTSDTGLAGAREQCLRRVDSEWFLFLDDDVRLDERYLNHLGEWVDVAQVGAVAGRKHRAAPGKHPSVWKRIRAQRANTHAVLVRHDAVAGLSIPSELSILHDEYLRRAVDRGQYNWVHDHRATFGHDAQASGHEPGYEQGYQGGKYSLYGWRKVLTDIPFALGTGRNPLPFIAQAVGWVAGQSQSHPPKAAISDGEVRADA